jgi:hypothetical protein
VVCPLFELAFFCGPATLIRQSRLDVTRETPSIFFVFLEMELKSPRNISCTVSEQTKRGKQMADRRNSERLIVPAESLERITFEKIGGAAADDQTQPMRLTFLALLAERDATVQAKLDLNRKLALAAELTKDEDRPTEPMLPKAESA